MDSIRERESLKQSLNADQIEPAWRRGEGKQHRRSTTMSKEEMKEELQKRKERTEANLKLIKYKKSFQMAAGMEVPSF